MIIEEGVNYIIAKDFVHTTLLTMAISALSQKITFEEFQAKSGITCKTTAKYVLKYLIKNGIGQVSQSDYFFSKADRIKLAILALESGSDIELISKFLNWQDFEAFTSNLLNLSGYITERNLCFSRPRRIQIDVVGVNRYSRIAIVVDCKHWKRNNGSTLFTYAKKQAERTSILLSQRGSTISDAIPVVLTLYPMDIKLIEDHIALVPIVRFNSFIQDISLFLSKTDVTSANCLSKGSVYR